MSAITWFELLSPKPTPLPACSVHTVEQCGILGMYAAHCVRSLSITGTSMGEIQPEVCAAVEPGTTICTDEHAAYNGMPQFTHLAVNHSAKEYVNGMAHTNGIESVWAVFKRGLHGIYHHVSKPHLNRYANEFAFRLNDGNVKRHTIDRLDSLTVGAAGRRITYKELIA